MNLSGVVRDGLLYVTLPLPGLEDMVEVEFIGDTGFDGGMVLSSQIVRQLEVLPSGYRARRLADGLVARSEVYELILREDDGEMLSVEIMVMEGNSLIGTEFLFNHSLYAELMDGGQVQIETL